MIEGLLDFFIDRVFPILLVGLIVCIGLLVLAGIAWVGCEVFARRWYAEGKVVGKTNTPDTRETNAVPVVTGNGTVGVGVLSTGHSREYIVLIEVGDAVYEFNNLTIYSKTKLGERVAVRMKRNAMSGISISEVGLK